MAFTLHCKDRPWDLFIIARVRSTTGGYVFKFRGEVLHPADGGYPILGPGGEGTLSQVQLGGPHPADRAVPSGTPPPVQS